MGDSSDSPGTTLLASCTNFGDNGTDFIRAYDCINGTELPENMLGQSRINLTTLQNAYEDEIMIFNQSRLRINFEGCVNTLQEECTHFYEDHGHDGRNNSANSRYPCYYTPDNSDFVVARFNLHHTRWLFSIFFVVPAGLFVMSCGILFACSRALNVDNSGHMKMECCAQSDMSSNLQFKYAEDADTL